MRNNDLLKDARLKQFEDICSLDELHPYSGDVFDIDDLAKVKCNGKWGLIDRQFKVVLPPKYDYISRFFHDTFYKVAIVGINGKEGLINGKFQEILVPKYDWIGFFKTFVTEVRLDGKYGRINAFGVEIIPPEHILITSIPRR